ncbi:MAG: hypothetical protein WBI40_04085 [Methylococcaceae bacterium]
MKKVILMLSLISTSSYAVEMEYCAVQKANGNNINCFSSPKECDEFLRFNSGVWRPDEAMCVAKPKS